MIKKAKHTIKPDIFYTAEDVHGEFHSSIKLSRGTPDLTPTATQWALQVRLTINDAQPAFDMMENIFKSFLVGSFSRSINKHKYEQTDNGFTVIFAPTELQGLGGGKRREVRSIRIAIKLGHKPHLARTKTFEEALEVLDHGFAVVIQRMAGIAPLIFEDSKASKLRSIMPLIRPLHILLQLDSESNQLEQIVERGLVQRGQSPATPIIAVNVAKQKSTQTSQQKLLETRAVYFPCVDFEHRKFMVIADEDGVCVHEPCFFNSLEGM